MTGLIPGIPGLRSSDETRPTSPTSGNPYLTGLPRDAGLPQDRFCGRGSSETTEPSWGDRAMGILRSIGQTLQLIDKPDDRSRPDELNPSRDIFGSH